MLCVMGAEKHQLLIVYPEIPESSKAEFRLKTDQTFRENFLLSKISLMSVKILRSEHKPILRSEHKPDERLATVTMLIETDIKCDPNILMNALSQNWPKVIVIETEDINK
jgi:hypothetical protein